MRSRKEIKKEIEELRDIYDFIIMTKPWWRSRKESTSKIVEKIHLLTWVLGESKLPYIKNDDNSSDGHYR